MPVKKRSSGTATVHVPDVSDDKRRGHLNPFEWAEVELATRVVYQLHCLACRYCQIDFSFQMVIFCSWACPPSVNTWTAWLLRSGNIWSVMVTRPFLAKTSTEDRSTSTRRVTVPACSFSGANSTLGNCGLNATLPDWVRST